MAISDAYAGYQCGLKWDDTTVGLVSGDDALKFAIDALRYATREEDGDWEGVVAGLSRVNGSFQVLSKLGDATLAAIQADMLAKTKKTLQITDPDGVGFSCSSLITAFDWSRPMNDVVKISMTVECHGKPTTVSAGS